MTLPVNPDEAAPPPEGDAGDQFPKIKISDLAKGGRSRTSARGRTRLNDPAMKILIEAGRVHKKKPLFPWIAIHEGTQDGSFYAVPTDENDEDRIRVSWPKAGQEVYFSLRKVLEAKQTSIPRRHSMVMDCFPANLPGYGAALEMRFGKARLEPVQSRSPRQQSEGGEMPPKA